MSVSQTSIHPLFLSRSQTSLSQVPTSFLFFSWNHPFRKPLQDVVGGELETSIRKDSNDCGGQTSIESPRPFCLVHRHHCMAKVRIDLDNKKEADSLVKKAYKQQTKGQVISQYEDRHFPLPKIQLADFQHKVMNNVVLHIFTQYSQLMPCDSHKQLDNLNLPLSHKRLIEQTIVFSALKGLGWHCIPHPSCASEGTKQGTELRAAAWDHLHHRYLFFS